MLKMRTRGKAGVWSIRGTVSLGDKKIHVPEFSAGTTDEDAAAFLMAQKEIELCERLMFGGRAIVAKATIADALDAYLHKAPKPHSTDVVRVEVIRTRIGQMSLGEPKAAWNAFRDAYLLGNAPAGQDRYRALLQACINVYHEKHDLPPCKLKAIPFDNQRIRFLSHDDRERLIESYVEHVRPIATVFAFQGARTQEVLQLVWGAGGADMERGTLFFPRTKTGNPRTVEMHPRVVALLRPMWLERGRPGSGHVFLNRLGKPYADTRDSKVQGGNPLKRAHDTACARAGIDDFTVHDWRHHWASHCVMAGIDLLTIMRLGGWKSLRMVQRYAAVDTTHMKEAVLKLR
ncbi:MAG: site-specific integrase [Sphingomonas sp.]|nr:site-specific integrase [Sphingomonas sp.]